MRPIRFLLPALTALILLSPLKTNAQNATPVIVTIVEEQNYADEVEALGTLRANEGVELTSSVTEIVTKILFTDNQRVKKGDILVEMDAEEERAEMAEQQSFAKEAQRQVNRLRPLVNQRAASESLLDENAQELEAAKARIQAIKSRIDQRVIRAPFDGVLGLRNISVGALAQPGTRITTIDDDSVMKLDFSVPEIFLASMKTGLKIKATSEAYPDKTFEGEISNVESRIDPVTRSIRARALINNDDRLLKPGLLMQVTVLKNPREAIVIPEESIISDGFKNYVFVINEADGKQSAERRDVKLGGRTYGKAEILDGLKIGEKIVTHGVLRVRPGAAVSITDIEGENDSLKDSLQGKNTAENAGKNEGEKSK